MLSCGERAAWRRDLKLLGGEASLTRSFDCDCAPFAHAHRRSASHCFRLRHLCLDPEWLGSITVGMVTVLPFTDDNRLCVCHCVEIVVIAVALLCMYRENWTGNPRRECLRLFDHLTFDLLPHFTPKFQKHP